MDPSLSASGELPFTTQVLLRLSRIYAQTGTTNPLVALRFVTSAEDVTLLRSLVDGSSADTRSRWLWARHAHASSASFED